MSTDWGIGCRTCRAAGKEREDYFTGEWDGCRGSHIGELRRLIDARAEVVAARAKLGAQVTFAWGDWPDSCAAPGVAEFFAAHEGHDLAPMNEYLDFDGDCRESFVCGCCGTRLSCVLPLGHPPEQPHRA